MKFDNDQTNNVDEANTLDDYEEGYFTAAFTCGTSGTVTVNGSYDQLAYTKIGRVVHVQGGVVLSSSSPVGTLSLNLPFTSATLTEIADYVMGVCSYYSVNALKSAAPLGIRFGQAATTAQINEWTTTSEVNTDMAENIGGSTQLYFAFTYIAA